MAGYIAFVRSLRSNSNHVPVRWFIFGRGYYLWSKFQLSSEEIVRFGPAIIRGRIIPSSKSEPSSREMIRFWTSDNTLVQIPTISRWDGWNLDRAIVPVYIYRRVVYIRYFRVTFQMFPVSDAALSVGVSMCFVSLPQCRDIALPFASTRKCEMKHAIPVY